MFKNFEHKIPIKKPRETAQTYIRLPRVLPVCYFKLDDWVAYLWRWGGQM